MAKKENYKGLKNDVTKLNNKIARIQKRANKAAAAGDMDQARFLEGDVKSLTSISDWIEEGQDWEVIWSLMCDVDTAVRDEIPARLYNYAAKVNNMEISANEFERIIQLAVDEFVITQVTTKLLS